MAFDGGRLAAWGGYSLLFASGFSSSLPQGIPVISLGGWSWPGKNVLFPAISNFESDVSAPNELIENYASHRFLHSRHLQILGISTLISALTAVLIRKSVDFCLFLIYTFCMGHRETEFFPPLLRTGAIFLCSALGTSVCRRVNVSKHIGSLTVFHIDNPRGGFELWLGFHVE